MKQAVAWVRTSVGVLVGSMAVVGCGTTTSEKPTPPFSAPPADCAPVQEVGNSSVSSFAGRLYEPSLGFRSERPEQEFAKVLTCYGVYVGNGQLVAGDADPRAATVYITIAVRQKDSFSSDDVVDETKRSFASYRDQLPRPAKIIAGVGNDAYVTNEATDTDARATVDFRVDNVTVQVRLNKTYAQRPTPQHESSVESDAVSLARSLAVGVATFM
ncbi:hypothetical protein [Nocardia mangyaensis]|uniref:hypothetical protein n=1 Tax=Nocardia mangyaensis TaxID=2213200 RepID=UPI002674EF84|nr:hypothetical protein [Nocardia mangyaensis]MDO3650308.1 hypothetical protein [Nocardia mangyaensis]